MAEEKSFGRIAFEAYQDSINQGRAWCNIGDDEQSAWEAAAQAVYDSIDVLL